MNATETTDKCPKCGHYKRLVFNNNPIGLSICSDCLNEQLDPQNLTHAEFFCRSFNYPWNPDRWLRLTHNGGDTFDAYAESCLNENRENLKYSGATADLWKKADEEWQRIRDLDTLIREITPLKEGFIREAELKWGAGYTFDQLMQLENLYETTVSTNQITAPFKLDPIKKACKISMQLDMAIDQGNSSAIKELSSAYAAFIKAAGIEDIVESADNSDTIRTIADLADYLESKNFEMTYYDNVDRDIVDKTIHDMQDYTRRLVTECTGLDTILERIAETYTTDMEQKATEEAVSAKPLEEIFSDYDEAQEQADQEDLAAMIEDIE